MAEIKGGAVPDHDALRLAELASISECPHELTEQEWDAPSLCDGWRVRDVVSHLCVGYTTPPDRLVAALDVVPDLAGFVGARQRVIGLRLVATDVDWNHGRGPEVTGPGEAILLAASGRPAGLEDLQGDGVDLLGERLAA